MNNKLNSKAQRRVKRQKRVRATISGTAKCPRINVFRSLRHLFVQLIDDEAGRTLVSVHTKKLAKGEAKEYKGKQADAYLAGTELAKKAKDLKINQAVFDRAGYKYHGRVKAVAEGARAGGLEF